MLVITECYSDALIVAILLQNSSAFVTTPTDGLGAGREEGLSHDQQEEAVPWAELKELISNNLEIIVSASCLT